MPQNCVVALTLWRFTGHGPGHGRGQRLALCLSIHPQGAVDPGHSRSMRLDVVWIPGCLAWKLDTLSILKNTMLSILLRVSGSFFFFWLPLYNNWCAIDELKVIWSCYEPCQFLDYPGPVSNINRLGLQWRLDHPTTLDTSSKTIISKGNPESHRTTARWNPTNLNKPPVICDIAMEISHLVQWFSYKNRDCP